MGTAAHTFVIITKSLLWTNLPCAWGLGFKAGQRLMNSEAASAPG